ncbi:hypothetical protein [Nocardia sp. CNY236]|uniref:hypothetical protein n=1 Tax=Nocardia sp. CNY236 TaxID=1169152 RepID=UPI0004027934|nr:hypothetical protein [Nocardia sp. CNY236]
MAVVPSARGTTIDIAGSAWPTHSFDALVIGLGSCAVVLLIVGSLPAAVLTAAGLATARWLGGRLRQRSGSGGCSGAGYFGVRTKTGI